MNYSYLNKKFSVFNFGIEFVMTQIELFSFWHKCFGEIINLSRVF